MTEDQKDKLGRLIDRLDNLPHGLEIPLPASMHVDQLKKILPEIVQEFKAIYVDVTKENPWE